MTCRLCQPYKTPQERVILFDLYRDAYDPKLADAIRSTIDLNDDDAKPILDLYGVKRQILIPDDEIETIFNSMKNNSIQRKGEDRCDWYCFGLTGKAAFREWIRRHCSRCTITGIEYGNLKRAGSGLSPDR